MGQCGNFEAAAHERHGAGVASDCNPEQSSDEMELAGNLTGAHPPGLPLPNRIHGLVTFDRAVGSPERAGALARSQAPLDGPMIPPQDVIEDVNDAERLSQDPTFRLIGSEKIWERGAALTSGLQSFETELLTQEGNLAGLAAINRESIAKAEAIDSGPTKCGCG